MCKGNQFLVLIYKIDLYIYRPIINRCDEETPAARSSSVDQDPTSVVVSVIMIININIDLEQIQLINISY